MIDPLKIFVEQTRFYQELLTSKNMSAATTQAMELFLSNWWHTSLIIYRNLLEHGIIQVSNLTYDVDTNKLVPNVSPLCATTF